MPQGQHGIIALSDITIRRDERQRRDLDSAYISSLADSIRRLGLIHAVVITRDATLVAGECRIAACRQLGWTHIPFQYEDEVDPATLHAIELEENIKRQDITWLERTQAIARYHELRESQEKEWSHERTAAALGLTQPTISKHMLVHRELSNPLVGSADRFSIAVNAATRVVERRKSDESIHHHTSGMDTQSSPILQGSFHEWAATYSGPKFNLIHCDFPYGIYSDKSGQSAVRALGGYSDDTEVYFDLLKTLAIHLDDFCSPSAHMIFWCSANIEIASRTFELLKLLDGFTFDEVPLVWMKSDGKGIAPDVNRRPRRIYEIAFFGWRGDRKLVRLKNNAFSDSIERSRHPHEKSQLALEYFFEAVVDGNTRLLDPTCGSGSALRAARALGAKDVFGIEQNEEFAKVAKASLRE